MQSLDVIKKLTAIDKAVKTIIRQLFELKGGVAISLKEGPMKHRILRVCLPVCVSPVSSVCSR